MKGITMAVSVGMAVAASAVAAPGMQLAPLFGDHAVLQRGKTIPIWGEGSQPRAKLACRLGNAVTWTRANGDGTFVFYLPPQEAGGPYELSVTNETRVGKAPSAEVFVCSKDVYVGEVWLCSGQSNMALDMRQANPGFGEETVDRLRLFAVPWNCRAGRPSDKVSGSWTVASPAAVQGKSAVATFFGRELERELGCAVGMLQSAVGGTLVQNWTSREGLLADPIGRRIVETYETGLSDPAVWTDPPPPDKEHPADTGIAPAAAEWARPGLSTNDWITADLPCDYYEAFGRAFNGAAWFRKDVEIPADWAGADLVLALPAVDKHDIAFFNGVEIGRTGKDFEWECWKEPRTYTVPGKLVKDGKATIAVRVWSYALGGGFMTGADHFSLGRGDAALELEGEWLARVERDVGNRSDNVPPICRPCDRSSGQPHALYDGMIAPLQPFAIRGAVWYQGESETGSISQALEHYAMLANMIRDWRHQWGAEHLPFCIVQLANYGGGRRYEKTSPWSEVRFAQLRLSRDVPGVGLVSAIDLGEATNIHPPDKLTVGKRLTNWAMADVYGDKGRVAAGPRFLSATVADGRVTVRFTDVGSGLVTRDGAPVGGLMLAGADGQFRPADGVIQRDALVVSSPGVPDPRALRYAWAKNPLGANLANQEGYPASPFRWTLGE